MGTSSFGTSNVSGGQDSCNHLLLLSVMQSHELEESDVMKKDRVVEGIRVTPFQYSNVSPSGVNPGQQAEVDPVIQVCG